MILSKLKDYADQQMNDLPPPMYQKKYVAWYVRLSEAGQYEGIVCLKSTTEKQGKEIIGPYVTGATGNKPKPNLLIGNGEFVFGVAKAKSKPERVEQCHAVFKQLIRDCAIATQNPYVQAIEHFLFSDNFILAKNDLPPAFDPNNLVTFCVGDIVPADAVFHLHDVETFWAQYTSTQSSHDHMTCLITGEDGPVEQRLPCTIEKLLTGKPPQMVSAKMVSAQSDPFSSYGLQNSLTSPISRDAAERFTKALNSLISDQQSRLYLGSTVYVFWTREPDEFDFFGALNHPTIKEIQALLQSPLKAQAIRLEEDEVNQFYALALTANKTRVVVRDWLETTLPIVKANLQSWFQSQQIVDAYGNAPRPFGVYGLAASVYRDAKKEMQPSAPIALLRCALKGDRLPHHFLTKLVQRIRTDKDITHPRAALLKLIFSNSATPTDQPMMTNMDSLNPNPNLEGSDRAAYDCGRLLAVLESTQRAAIGSVNASLTDRYYGSASSTPAIAFPPLLKGVRSHLSKLRKVKPGVYVALEERLETVVQCILPFPKTLTLQQQGLFGLGYYHQRASDRAAAKAKAAEKKAQAENDAQADES